MYCATGCKKVKVFVRECIFLLMEYMMEPKLIIISSRVLGGFVYHILFFTCKMNKLTLVSNQK